MPIFLNKKHPVILVITGWDDVGGLAETTTNEAASLPSHECRVWPRHEWHHHEHVSSTRRNVKASPNGEATLHHGTLSLKFVSAIGVSDTPNILIRLGTHTEDVRL
jgi:hypothetical protein